MESIKRDNTVIINNCQIEYYSECGDYLVKNDVEMKSEVYLCMHI